jgi:hypothetical protein
MCTSFPAAMAPSQNEELHGLAAGGAWPCLTLVEGLGAGDVCLVLLRGSPLIHGCVQWNDTFPIGPSTHGGPPPVVAAGTDSWGLIRPREREHSLKKRFSSLTLPVLSTAYCSFQNIILFAYKVAVCTFSGFELGLFTASLPISTVHLHLGYSTRPCKRPHLGFFCGSENRTQLWNVRTVFRNISSSAKFLQPRHKSACPQFSQLECRDCQCAVCWIQLCKGTRRVDVRIDMSALAMDLI